MLDARPPVDPADPLIGQQIGDYVVTEAVAQGGMSIVYRGVHPLIKKRVAIKVLKEARKAGGERMDKLIAEAEAVNSIGHRNIVDIFGLGQLPDGRAYIIMEFLEGQALDAWLEQRGADVPFTEVVEILIEICSPLSAAHRARVIHRDLKPSNVFLCHQPDGARFLKLLDFGLAKKAAGFDGVTEQTSRASVAGTPDYMAPEHARGKAISPRTDLYALGCIAYRMLTGVLPFPGQTAMDVMIAHVRLPVPRVSDRRPDVPPRLDELVVRLMAKTAEVRPASADEVRVELERVLQELRASSASQPVAPLASTTPDAAPQATDGAIGPPRASPQVPGARSSAPRIELPAADPSAPPVASETAPQLASVPPRRTGVPGAVAVVAVVAIVAVAFTLWWVLGRAPAPAFVPAPELLPVVESGAGLSGAAAPREDPPAPAVTGVTAPVAGEEAQAARPDEGPSLEELAPVPGTAPRALEARGPTVPELRARLERLQERLAAGTPAGADPDPAAQAYLDKLKIQATMAASPVDRLKVARQLDAWERLFLRR